MPSSQIVDVSLKYHGPDVDDGTMLVEDVVPALQGFSNAYSKIVATKNLPYEHKIRITGLTQGSFDISLQVWEAITSNTDQIQAVGVVAGGAVGVIKIIFGVIDMIKHTKNRPLHTKIGEGNVVIVVNSDGVEKEFPLEVFNIFSEKTIVPDLSKIVNPLETGKIDSLDVTALLDSKTISTTIADEEKPYFDGNVEEIAKTQEAELQGEFVSLNKHTNRGKFSLTNGKQILYQLPNERPERFYPFVIDKGRLMKVKSIVHLDSNLDVLKIDILDVEAIQQSLIDKN
jgi:hypothetical protein